MTGFTPLYNFTPIERVDPDTNEALRQIDDSLRFIFQNIAAGGGGVQQLDDLLDVALTNPQEGDFLLYDSASGEWQNSASSSIPVNLDDLTDVSITTPRKEEKLWFNGALWINRGPENLTFSYASGQLAGIDGADTNIDFAYNLDGTLNTVDNQTDILTFGYTSGQLTSITVSPS